MKILLLGCEYTGTTTLAQNIFEWGQNNMGADFGLFHDHWKIPHVTGHWPIDTDSYATDQEQNELINLNPKMKEQMQIRLNEISPYFVVLDNDIYKQPNSNFLVILS